MLKRQLTAPQTLIDSALAHQHQDEIRVARYMPQITAAAQRKLI